MSVAEIAAALQRRRAGRHLLLLLDFDGTSCPFRVDPSGVQLDSDVRRALDDIAWCDATLGFVSGRRIADLRRRVRDTGSEYLAGFHGLEIEGPDERFVDPAAALSAAAVQAVAFLLAPRLPAWPGVFLENKEVSVVLHFRAAIPEHRRPAEEALRRAAAVWADRLTLLSSSGALELLPVTQCNKGTAVDWIRQRVQSAKGPTFTIYIGDDGTDENAFIAVAPDGASVAASNRPRGAQYYVDGPAGVAQLLSSLAAACETTRSGR